MARSSRVVRVARPRRSPSAVWLQRLKSIIQAIRVEPSQRRLVAVWLVLVLGTLLLAANLFYVQVRQGGVLQAVARQQQQVWVRPFVPRRTVLDRLQNVVALDRPVFSLYAHPKLFKEPKPTVAAKLAPILDRPASAIVQQLNQQDTGVRLEHALTEDQANRVAALQLEGIERIQAQERLYPQQDVLSSVVGFVNSDHRGQAGVELSQQTLLERPIQARSLSRMGDGSLLPDQVPGGFFNIDDLQLHLTLDSKLQKIAIAALKDQMDAFSAKRGTVIVIDVRDGSLLVLADEPSYNPNEYYNFPIECYKNWALTDLYEPGSTFKPINIAIALEAKAIRPDDVFDVPSAITIGEDTIQNAGGAGYGPIDVTDIVKHSSNVGMVQIVRQMKPEAYYDWLKALGLGEAVGIDLPAEVAGQFKDRKTFLDYAIEPAVTSFGQGFSMTPVQLAQLHAAIANGGRLVTPHVVQGLYDSKGALYWKPKLRPAKTVFSPATTKAVLNMMEAVVAEGTGEPAQIAGYRVGGKTGTAQKASPYGGYAEGLYITSFVGILPIEAPRFVVLAVIDEPQGGNVAGSTVAAPIVKRVMEALITAEKLPPSRPVAPREATAELE